MPHWHRYNVGRQVDAFMPISAHEQQMTDKISAILLFDQHSDHTTMANDDHDHV